MDSVALLDEALKKSQLIWIGPAGGQSKAVWHVWESGSVWLICGGGEQPQPVQPDETAVIVVRSKDKGVRLVSVEAAVEVVADGEDWDRIAAVMVTKRLNLVDTDEALQRWARDATMLRLTPAAELLEGPGNYDPSSHATEPAATSAGTKVPRPWHLFGRQGRADRIKADRVKAGR